MTPHDALFKAAFSDLGRAAEELRHALGPELAARIDFTTLALEPGSFIDDALREHHADRLYSVALDGRRTLVYVLFEHQSTDDPWTPLWLLNYLVRIWEGLVREDRTPRRLPAIVPVVLHHSERGWRSATSFQAILDLDDAPAELRAHVPSFRFALDDLAATTDEQLRRRAMTAGTRLVLLALQQTRTRADFFNAFRGWLGLMRDLRDEPGGQAALRLVFRYISEVRGIDDRRIIDVIATEVGKEEAAHMQSMADAWREEGLQKGIQQGLQQGREQGRLEEGRAFFLRMLRRRFGAPPAAVLARVELADLPTLERWGDALLDACSLDDLFPPL